MNIFKSSKLVSRSLIATMGVGAIALSMLASEAHAGKLRAGKDFWKTPAGGGNIELPVDIELPPDFFGVGSLPITIPAGVYVLDGHPIDDLMGMLPGPAEQKPEICFDQHGNQVSGMSEHAVDCIPPMDPDLPWTDTIVERLEDSSQLSEVGDMAIIPIQMKMVSLVSPDPISVPFSDGSTQDYFLKALQDDDEEQLVGNLKLTVTEIVKMGNMTFVNGIPSIGFNENCSLDPQAPNFDPECLGLPVSFDLLFKDAITGEFTDSFYSDTIFLEDGTQPGNEDDVYFSFKKTPEPSAIVPLAFLGLAGIWGVKKKQSLK